MSDNDLIRRGDALDAAWEADSLELSTHGAGKIEARINAIPAVQPTVKPLVWESHPMGWIAGAMFGPAYIIDVRIKGRVMFIKGMNPPPQFDDLEAAKAAAQADYDARILSALDMQPTVSPDVAALVKAAEAQIQYMDMCHDNGDLERNLRAALARVKGETK